MVKKLLVLERQSER